LDQTALTPEEEELQDPVERQYRQLEQRVQAFEHQKAADELERTVASLQSKYEDFDANEVVNRALALGSTDLEAVYKQISFDKVYEDAKAIRQIRSKAAEEQTRITSAKRQAGVVSGASTSTSADVSAKPITSLREAFEAAKRQHA
jgi:isoleucyl-tRNA synthetase